MKKFMKIFGVATLASLIIPLFMGINPFALIPCKILLGSYLATITIKSILNISKFSKSYEPMYKDFYKNIDYQSINLFDENLDFNKIKEPDTIEEKEVLKDGKTIKRRKIVQYICLNKKDKLRLLKYITIYERGKLYRKISSTKHIMTDDELISEGFIDKKGNLTEKAKTLKLLSEDNYEIIK